MNQTVSVAGITFVNKAPAFETIRPNGLLMLKHEPDNKFDKNAVQVWFDCPDNGAVRLGYLPAQNGGDKLQKEVIAMIEAGEPVFCGVVRYAYSDKDAGWNEDHKGRLGAVQMFVGDDKDDVISNCKSLRERAQNAAKERDRDKGTKQADGGTSEPKVTSNSYEVDGKVYRRLTDLLGCYEADGKEAFDRLIAWAINQGALAIDNLASTDAKSLGRMIYTGYKDALNKAADDGTAMHLAIELWLKGDKDQVVPQGFLNWHEKYKPEVMSLETTIFDDDIMVAGTFDGKFKVTIKGEELIVAADWKSSKAVRTKHKMQAGWYAHKSEADEAWVIAFGANTKQGYSMNRQTKEQCAIQYEKVAMLKKLQDMG